MRNLTVKRPIPARGRQQVAPGRATPQQKIISVTDRMGLTGIKNQQGTTVIKYDTLPLDGRTIYRFFEEAQTRSFPLSNVGTDGGKLGVGETIVVQRYTLQIVTYTGTFGSSGMQITNIAPLTKTTVGIIDGEMTINIANNNVLLRKPIVQALPEYNKDAENQVNVSYEFDTYLVIPPELNYIFEVRCSGATTAQTALRLTIEGVGSIFSPRNNF